MARASTPRPSSVTRLEPTLTTMRRAAQGVAHDAAPPGGRVVEARIRIVRHHVAQLRHVLVDRPHQRLAQPSRVRPRSRTPGPSSAAGARSPSHRFRAPRPAPCRACSAPASAAWRAARVVLSVRRRSRAPAPPDRRPRRTARDRPRAAAGGALQVAQEQVPEARASGGTFDQAGCRPPRSSAPDRRTTPRLGCSVVNG